MNIKVLGPGCARCEELEKTVREIVALHQLDIQVEEVRDMKKIMQYSIMATPALVINEKVVISGRVPGRAELESLIMTALAKEE